MKRLPHALHRKPPLRHALAALAINMFIFGTAFGQGSGSNIRLDGSNDYVSIPHNASLNLTNTWTIEFWMNPDVTPSGWDAIISKNVSDRPVSVWMYFNSIEVWYGSGTNGLIGYSSFGSIAAGEWQHVAVSRDNSNAVRIYINGVLESTWTGTSTPPTNSSPLVFGQRGDNIYYMDGFLDEVRYWNVTRSQTDIRDHMCSTLTGSETGLVGYWKLDDGSGTTATDDAGSFDGTLTSGPTWNTSGAPIGDASTYLYTNSWSGQTLSLSSPEGDFMEISNVTNSPDGMVLYRVDNTPNSSTGISGLGDNAHYFGVFKSNGASTTYTMTYNYAGNDGYEAGVPDADLRIYQRDDNSVTTWTTTTTTLDAVNQTLTATGQNTEYILGSSSGGAVLPIELGSFSAQLTPYGVDVFWTTMAEINNDYFLVERSQNGKDGWQLIGRTPGAGNSSDPLNYELNDPSPLPGNSYYRLTQVDFNGTSETFAPVRVSNARSMDMTVFPVPAREVATIRTEAATQATITTLDGVVLSEHTLHAGDNRIDINHLKAGVYLVRCPASGNDHVTRLVVQP